MTLPHATCTVVIPCYNYGRFLPASVGSALAQEEVAVDVLIVDDASPDGSGDIAEALAADDGLQHAIVRRLAEQIHRDLAALNRSLEERVESQVDQMSRLDRLRRFLSPSVAEAV